MAEGLQMTNTELISLYLRMLLRDLENIDTYDKKIITHLFEGSIRTIEQIDLMHIVTILTTNTGNFDKQELINTLVNRMYKMAASMQYRSDAYEVRKLRKFVKLLSRKLDVFSPWGTFTNIDIAIGNILDPEHKAGGIKVRPRK